MPKVVEHNVPTAQALQTAVAHHQAGRLPEAEQIYRQILAAEPDNADALQLLGLVRHQTGNNENAVDLIEKAHRLRPPQAFSLNSLGMAYLGLKRAEDARRCFSRALKLEPDYAEAHNNLGAAITALGKLDQAVPSYRRAVALQPTYVDAHYNLGTVLDGLGRLEDAEECYRRALALDPAYANAHGRLGLVLARTGRVDEAEGSYRSAIALAPTSAQARVYLGSLLNELGRPDEAEQCFREALAVDPRYARAASNLGATLYDMGRWTEAEQSYRRALAIDPDYDDPRWALTVSRLASLPGATALKELRELSDWFDRRAPSDFIDAVGSLQPFYLAYCEENNRELLSEYGNLCAKLMHRWRAEQRFSLPRRSPTQKVRIGVVSAQVRDHSVWNAIVKGWFRHLDRTRFELSILSLGSRQDQETAAAKSMADHFAQGGPGLRQNVEAILGRQPDALIYPEIGMDAMTLKLASLRLAPVQIATWGHPETTGLPTIDYYLSAEDLEPAGAQENYREELVMLPHLGCCYSPLALTPDHTEFAALGINWKLPVLLCPGSPFKYPPEHDWVFTEIARRLGSCQLVFFTVFPQELSDALRSRLREAFSRAGMEFERYVTFIPKQSLPAFHGLMQRADVFLDTIGFSGFNTAMQAAQCGLPIVTREGRFLRGRLASGILKRMGLQELVAPSEEAYVELAVRLARDAGYRQNIRARTQAAVSTVYEDVAPIRALEDFLLRATTPAKN